MSNITPCCPKCLKVAKVRAVGGGFGCDDCGPFKVTGPTVLSLREDAIREGEWKPKCREAG